MHKSKKSEKQGLTQKKGKKGDAALISEANGLEPTPALLK